MKPLTVVIPYRPGASFNKSLHFLINSTPVERAIIVSEEPLRFKMKGCQVFLGEPLLCSKMLRRILSETRTKYLLLLPESPEISVEPEALERILGKARSLKAGLIYSDFDDEGKGGKTLHSLNDYQLGSVRDDFDLGAMFLYSVPAIRRALKKYSPIRNLKFAGLYDLRLKVSIDHPVHHLKEPLYSVMVRAIHELRLRKKMFAYLDPRNRDSQKEMEIVFTDYLKKIGAYVPNHQLRDVKKIGQPFAVEASVIISVRNRKETVIDAVKSALSQKTDFAFNIIVVDNHSTDGTTKILSDLTQKYPRLEHVVPKRTDLGIGGCWNEALCHKACGRYAVQLDSDDLYRSPYALQKIVDMFRQCNYAMVIGSYTLVDSRLKRIPQGVIDHREWTDENGHNNALRINGLGAPRAFDTGLMRRIKFLNVSYGEDYAAGLRICREYRIGRIYESLYLCRRWSGNTDAALSIEERNRNDAFKDKIRTAEILARQKINQEKIPSPIPFDEGAIKISRGRPCRVSLRGREATEAISKANDIREIATLPLVARNDKKGIAIGPQFGDRGEKDSFKQKIYSTFDGKGGKVLPEVCLDLLSEQKKTWQDLRDGYALLEEVRERDISCNEFSIRLQYNPGRIKSSTADVGERDLKRRPCFLCLDHLPEGQKGILHRDEYLILCNPMPVFHSHLTVSHIDHRPQSISENSETFLQLMVDLGSGWTVLYNGPKCGASAPDHLHFQAVPSGRMPIEKETIEEKRRSMKRRLEGVSLHRILNIGREVIIVEGKDLRAVGNLIKSLLKGLKSVLLIPDPLDEEPLVNVAGFYDEKKWRVIIFPRRKHRPDVFFKEGDERVVVSPGAIDMGGVLITPVKKDFERLDAPFIESIYREVSLQGKIVEKAIDTILKQGNL